MTQQSIPAGSHCAAAGRRVAGGDRYGGRDEAARRGRYGHTNRQHGSRRSMGPPDCRLSVTEETKAAAAAAGAGAELQLCRPGELQLIGDVNRQQSATLQAICAVRPAAAGRLVWLP